MNNIIEYIAVFIAIVIISRSVYSIFSKANIRTTLQLYFNNKMKYVYLVIFIAGSCLLVTRINIYEYFIAFITFGALFLDYFNVAVIPKHVKKLLYDEISTPRKMIVYIVVGLTISILVIIHFLQGISY